MEPYLQQGLISDSKVLDIRQVDVGSQPYMSLRQLTSYLDTRCQDSRK